MQKSSRGEGLQGVYIWAAKERLFGFQITCPFLTDKGVCFRFISDPEAWFVQMGLCSNHRFIVFRWKISPYLLLGGLGRREDLPRPSSWRECWAVKPRSVDKIKCIVSFIANHRIKKATKGDIDSYFYLIWFISMDVSAWNLRWEFIFLFIYWTVFIYFLVHICIQVLFYLFLHHRGTN